MPDRCHLVATKGIFSTWIFWAAHVCWAWPKGSWVLWAAPCSKKCWQHLPPEPCSRLTSPPEISNTGLPPSQRAQGMDLGVCASGKQPTPPCTDPGGDWIPHLVLPHPPHSSASSQAVSHFPLVFIPAFPLVKPKAGQPHTIPTETGIRKPRRAIKPNKGLPTTPNHILPRFSLQVPPQAPAAAQGRLSPGFAFLGNHGAPVSCKPLLPQLRIIPPAAV